MGYNRRATRTAAPGTLGLPRHQQTQIEKGTGSLRRVSLPLSAAALLQDERRLRVIGDWGSASGHIGRRWEEIGTTALAEWVKGHLPGARLANLADREDLRKLFGSLGLTNPDAVLVQDRDGRSLIRPIDLKWTLEVASYRQISASALAELLAAAGEPLARVIHDAAFDGGDGRVEMTTRDWVPEDGFFFVVDSAANRRYLSSAANSSQEYPLEPSEVVFQPVGPTECFSPLPGWELATRLADLDRSTYSLRSVDGAAAYYRLGAGVRGALLKLKTAIFVSEPAECDVIRPFEHLLSEHRLASSAAVVAALEPDLARRAERHDRLRAVCRSPFAFEQFREKLARRGIDLDGITDYAERDALLARYRLVARRHRERVIKAGQNLMARGFTEVKALVALEKRAAEFQQRAAADAEQALANL